MAPVVSFPALDKGCIFSLLEADAGELERAQDTFVIGAALRTGLVLSCLLTQLNGSARIPQELWFIDAPRYNVRN